MKWFEGSIPEAIQLAKNKQSIFLVYIYGNNDASTRLNESLDDPLVDQICVSSDSVAIRLEVKSEAGIQFSQIYPVVIVPCVFFIGANGIPLEVVADFIAPAELAQKFTKAVQLHQSSLASPSLSQPTTTSLSSNPEVAAASVQSESTPPVEGIHDQSGATGGTSSGLNPVTDSSKESLEQKKEKALQLLAKKREEKAREEEEKEKQREAERRKLGQDMAKLKQMKEERERKEVANSYKKQKEEDRLAREKVRADLERDRQERALRFQQEKVDKDVAIMRAKSEKLAAQADEEAKLLAVRRESARVQFRLPDGSSFMQVFSSSEPLANCRTFVTQKLSWKTATLSTLYPKRTFTEADMSQTLLDLLLAPSAVLIVLPSASGRQQGGGGGGSGGGVMAIVWMLLAPFIALWALVSNFLFAAPQPLPAASVSPRSADSRAGTAAAAAGSGSLPDSDQTPAGARRRTTNTGSDRLKRHQDGNIRRFTADDDDDENATWNGNSTQQM